MGPKFKIVSPERLQKLSEYLEGFAECYLLTGDFEALNKNLHKTAKAHKNIMLAFDYFILKGEELIKSAKRDTGFAYFLAVEEYLEQRENAIADTVTLFLRLAQYYFENDEEETGIYYLTKLCTDTVDNYEESLEIRKLTHIWDKYKHLVAGKVPESITTSEDIDPIMLEVESTDIKNILTLPKELLLPEISSYLSRKCGCGRHLNRLNKWEKTVYYVDHICIEINSDGFAGYLYYDGIQFRRVTEAVEAIKSPKMLDLLNRVQSKFPSQKVPKTIDAIQNQIEKMENNGIDFEDEDEAFYNEVQEELLDKLYEFIKLNQHRFR